MKENYQIFRNSTDRKWADTELLSCKHMMPFSKNNCKGRITDAEVESGCAREKAYRAAMGTEAYGAVGPDDVKFEPQRIILRP